MISIGANMNGCFVVDVIQDLANINALVNSFFNDEKKTTLWMNTPNPLLGGQVPNDMIFQRRTEKLRGFIETTLAGNRP
jgi:uncharacterized protein (DUF2384 family)